MKLSAKHWLALFLPRKSGSALTLYYALHELDAVTKFKRSPLQNVFVKLGRSRYANAVEAQSASIPLQTKIGSGLRLPHEFHGIHIGSHVQIGSDCTIMQGVTIGVNIAGNQPVVEEAPVIGSGVFIGAGAQVIGRTVIGDGAKIGAGVTLVNATIESGATIINKSAYDLTNKRYVYPQD